MNKDEIEMQLLSLSYERYVSRAHTIFSAFCDIFFGIIVGGLGTVLAFIQAKVFEFQRLKPANSKPVRVLVSTEGVYKSLD